MNNNNNFKGFITIQVDVSLKFITFAIKIKKKKRKNYQECIYQRAVELRKFMQNIKFLVVPTFPFTGSKRE